MDMDKLWTKICLTFSNSEESLAIYGTVLFSTMFFWLVNLPFIFADFLQWPLAPYKIQPSKTFSTTAFWKAVRVVLFNQLIIGGPMTAGMYRLMKWRGCRFGSDELPSFGCVIRDFCIFAVVEEIGAYYTHRLLHHSSLYRHIHKQHHEWTAPISVASIYVHPFEHAFSNMAPFLMGPLIAGSHLATLWMWAAFAVWSTTISHCGYHLPFLPSPEAHDFHHQMSIDFYGVLGILDWLHGTDKSFRKSQQFKRHRVFYTLTSPRLLLPDEGQHQPNVK